MSATELRHTNRAESMTEFSVRSFVYTIWTEMDVKQDAFVVIVHDKIRLSMYYDNMLFDFIKYNTMDETSVAPSCDVDAGT
jgi:hypothetical protein